MGASGVDGPIAEAVAVIVSSFDFASSTLGPLGNGIPDVIWLQID